MGQVPARDRSGGCRPSGPGRELRRRAGEPRGGGRPHLRTDPRARRAAGRGARQRERAAGRLARGAGALRVRWHLGSRRPAGRDPAVRHRGHHPAAGDPAASIPRLSLRTPGPASRNAHRRARRPGPRAGGARERGRRRAGGSSASAARRTKRRAGGSGPERADRRGRRKTAACLPAAGLRRPECGGGREVLHGRVVPGRRWARLRVARPQLRPAHQRRPTPGRRVPGAHHVLREHRPHRPAGGGGRARRLPEGEGARGSTDGERDGRRSRGRAVADPIPRGGHGLHVRHQHPAVEAERGRQARLLPQQRRAERRCPVQGPRRWLAASRGRGFRARGDAGDDAGPYLLGCAAHARGPDAGRGSGRERSEKRPWWDWRWWWPRW